MVARPCGAALAKGRVAFEARLSLGWQPTTRWTPWKARVVYLAVFAAAIFLCWAGVPLVFVGFLVGEDGDYGEPCPGGPTVARTGESAADRECRAEEQGDEL